MSMSIEEVSLTLSTPGLTWIGEIGNLSDDGRGEGVCGRLLDAVASFLDLVSFFLDFLVTAVRGADVQRLVGGVPDQGKTGHHLRHHQVQRHGVAIVPGYLAAQPPASWNCCPSGGTCPPT